MTEEKSAAKAVDYDERLRNLLKNSLRMEYAVQKVEKLLCPPNESVDERLNFQDIFGAAEEDLRDLLKDRGVAAKSRNRIIMYLRKDPNSGINGGTVGKDILMLSDFQTARIAQLYNTERIATLHLSLIEPLRAEVLKSKAVTIEGINHAYAAMHSMLDARKAVILNQISNIERQKIETINKQLIKTQNVCEIVKDLKSKMHSAMNAPLMTNQSRLQTVEQIIREMDTKLAGDLAVYMSMNTDGNESSNNASPMPSNIYQIGYNCNVASLQVLLDSENTQLDSTMDYTLRLYAIKLNASAEIEFTWHPAKSDESHRALSAAGGAPSAAAGASGASASATVVVSASTLLHKLEYMKIGVREPEQDLEVAGGGAGAGAGGAAVAGAGGTEAFDDDDDDDDDPDADEDGQAAEDAADDDDGNEVVDIEAEAEALLDEDEAKDEQEEEANAADAAQAAAEAAQAAQVVADAEAAAEAEEKKEESTGAVSGATDDAKANEDGGGASGDASKSTPEPVYIPKKWAVLLDELKENVSKANIRAILEDNMEYLFRISVYFPSLDRTLYSNAMKIYNKVVVIRSGVRGGAGDHCIVWDEVQPSPSAPINITDSGRKVSAPDASCWETFIGSSHEMSSGKHKWKIRWKKFGGSYQAIAVVTNVKCVMKAETNHRFSDNKTEYGQAYYWHRDGEKIAHGKAGTETSLKTSVTKWKADDIITVVLDCDANTIQFMNNTDDIGTFPIAEGLTWHPMILMCTCGNEAESVPISEWTS